MKISLSHYLRISRNLTAGWMPFGRRICVLCGHRVWRFMPYGGGSPERPELMCVLDTIGSNVDAFSCPRCGAHDRERHLYMYMQATGLLDDLRGKSILHFAPEQHLSRLIETKKPALYICCDLYPASADLQQIDIQSTGFEADSFDIVIANHVLEHVDSVDLALKEIVRILRNDGIAILQTPFSSKLHNTWEDAGISDPDARLQAYGQADHVRLFGRDIFERFAAAGLTSCVRQHEELLADVDSDKMGVNESEPFFLFKKM